MKHYQVDYNRYSFKSEDDWGDYDNGKYREPCFNKGGYNYKPYFCKDNKWHSLFEHRVKWEYFNGKIPEGCEIDHIIPVRNGGTNKLSNLRVVTKKENANNPISLKNKSKAGINRFSKNGEKEKQSERLLKRWKNEEERKKQSERQLNRWKNEKERKKYSEMFKGENNPNYGNKWSDEQKEKLSLFHKTNEKALAHTYEINMRKRKKLIQILPNGEKVEWESTREASRKTGLGQSNIAAACRGERNHKYKGYNWYYKDET